MCSSLETCAILKMGKVGILAVREKNLQLYSDFNVFLCLCFVEVEFCSLGGFQLNIRLFAKECFGLKM